jgi:hypothetical protein
MRVKPTMGGVVTVSFERDHLFPAKAQAPGTADIGLSTSGG